MYHMTSHTTASHAISQNMVMKKQKKNGRRGTRGKLHRRGGGRR